MLFFCPGCQRTFDETGFCPFDRTQLVSMSDARTIVTGAMQAVPGPHPAALDRLGTLPLTSAPVTARGGADTARDPAPRAASTVPAVPPALAEAREARDARDAPAAPAAPAPKAPRQALATSDTVRESEYDRLVGQTLDGRYHIEQKIGEGGMGVVFAVRHAVIERPLAIKVLKREVMRDAATAQRFVQEAKAASRIGHPNIVDVTDFGTTPEGMTYSVMEYVSGQTLGAALRGGGPFEPPRAVRIAAQLARALGAAHDKGIVHRDLKPENVFLVDRDGRPDFVKIVDFGIAKVTPPPGQDQDVTVPRLTRAGSVFGTPEYMAPEQAAGRDTDARVDVYALGVILYEMVTGRVPHKGETMVRTLAAQLMEPAVPPSQVRPDRGISPELEALILKALAKPREQRFQTMGELLAALDQLPLPAPAAPSVSKSRVFGLVALPPGADPAATAASGPIHVAQPITDVNGRPAAAPGGHAPRRSDAEPAVVGGDPPLAPERAGAGADADADADVDADAPRTYRTWPVLLLSVVIFVGAAALALVLTRRSRAPDPAQASGSQAPGPTLAAADPRSDTPADADAPPADAPTPPTDAPAVAADEPSDAGARPRDPGLGVTAPRRDPVEIQILTKPEGGTLYIGNAYRGVSGAHVSEAFGTRLEVTCKHPGYRDGVVKLVFDGKRQAELCVLQRIVICIPGVKNPFDKCPE